jgi:hypothetical protein
MNIYTPMGSATYEAVKNYMEINPQSQMTLNHWEP